MKRLRIVSKSLLYGTKEVTCKISIKQPYLCQFCLIRFKCLTEEDVATDEWESRLGKLIDKGKLEKLNE